jgi:phosphatidylglycerol:prolipoprotein diacylglycerol transferase
MEYWNHIYEHFNPIAFTIFSFPVHWYGMMYVLALISALYVAKSIVKRDKLPIKQAQLDDYFIYIEVGIILGARLGYILFYDSNTGYYLTHPWQIFNPFNQEGEFVGIRGMSYHGAVIGWFLGSLYYHKRNKEVSFGVIMDVVALAVPIGYMFGRVGNFLNQELVGRTTDLPWGIYVDGVLRHPSLMRFVAEFWRQPDSQLGFLFGGWLTMGQSLSAMMMAVAVVLWFYFDRKLSK